MSRNAADPSKSILVSARKLRAAALSISLPAVGWTAAGYWWLPPFAYWWSSTAIVAIGLLLAFGLAVRPGWRNGLQGDDDLWSPIAEALIKFSPVALAVLNRSGRIVEMNESSSRLLGHGRPGLIGKHLLPLVHDESKQMVIEKFERTLSGEMQELTVGIVHDTGHPLNVHITMVPLERNEANEGAVVISQDLSDRKRNLERIRYMAYYDDMTGLPNRRSFMLQLSDCLAVSRTSGALLAILYLDVDRFKLINASFGRDFGDMLLLQMAERLTRELPDEDIAARMEGDEFAILYSDAGTESELLDKAKAVLQLLEETFELQGVPFHVTASMGIAVNAVEHDNAESLLKKAELALDRVKKSGKNNCLIYSESWNDGSLERLKLQHDMKRALQNREFLLHYQPQYHLGNGSIVGVEALVRWMHPERGLVPPGQFIPLAEESGMIMQIGDWVLEEACRQNKAWQEAGLTEIPVSVNLSIRQFLQQDLTGKVADILVRTGLRAEFLDLEITETMTMDVAHASRCLLELSELGVNISIDDFGTGYSSFHYLKNLPIDRVKIDRSFVRDIQQDPSDAAIVAAIIAMAHNLNLQVIAEGVENEDQMQFLQQHLCDEMQGFYWSPPVAGSRIAELLQSAAAQ